MGRYHTRPMRPTVVEAEYRHKGSGWYEIVVDGDVVEDGIRGKDAAQQALNKYQNGYANRS